jgi:cyclophilin family peptidyl-prolyl cis-trans isomerase
MARDADLVLAVGGRAWHGIVEADALADELVRLGVKEDIILRERRSRTTRENARFTRELLVGEGLSPSWNVIIVTCTWHLPRAEALFRAEGIDVTTFAADPGASSWGVRTYRRTRERIAWKLDVLRALFMTLALLGCGRKPDASTDASPADASVADSGELSTLAVAEDTRRADLVTDAMGTSRNVAVRRRAARALSRIADSTSEAGLVRALGDEDEETAAWGAYGLGFSCKGHEDARVRALVARAASWEVDVSTHTGAALDFEFAVARAVGRCGGGLAEATLASWVRAKGRSVAWREDAAYGLGDVAARLRTLDDDTITALLDAAQDGVPAALYPFARADRFNDAFASRLLDAARKVISGPKSDARVFGVRALAKVGDGGIADLSRVATSTDYSPTERVDAIRALGRLGDAGRVAALDVLARILPNPEDPFAVLAMSGDAFAEVVSALAVLGPTPPATATSVLTKLATLRPLGEAPPMLTRRLATIRCTASALLARGNPYAPLLRACDATSTMAFERGELLALSTTPLFTERRDAWAVLTKSDHIIIREEALALVSHHQELGAFGLRALQMALSDTAHSGVVAAAADVLASHPERAMVLSAKERRNAIDPSAPPPTATPEQELSPGIAKALEAAMDFKWNADAIETRAALLDAASMLHAPNVKDAAKAACIDPNITIREHASKALRALGDDKTTCPAPRGPAVPAKEALAPHGGKLTLTTDAGTLSIVFDPFLAPVASTRILDLAAAGFYDNTFIHRVVSAFVVQLGDPQGDGYGGSGESLRCETSPIPFAPLDVGMALAGRDTGSSQFFVTLGRFPHLDGDFAHVGRADGDWAAVAEGDVVQHVKVE